MKGSLLLGVVLLSAAFWGAIDGIFEMPPQTATFMWIISIIAFIEIVRGLRGAPIEDSK